MVAASIHGCLMKILQWCMRAGSGRSCLDSVCMYIYIYIYILSRSRDGMLCRLIYLLQLIHLCKFMQWWWIYSDLIQLFCISIFLVFESFGSSRFSTHMCTEVCQPFERFIIKLARWNIVCSLLTLFSIRLYREIPFFFFNYCYFRSL